MNEEEKKVVEDYKSKLDLYKYEKKIGLGRINIDEKIYEMEVIINVIERLQKENESWKSYSEELEEEQIEKNNKNCELEFEVEKLQKENELAKQEYDRDTHILQNQLDLANADRIDLAQQNKELRKENEALKVLEDDIQDKRIAYVDEPEFEENYISKQKIKDKLEELNKEIKSCTEIDAIFKIKQQQILQELLESEEEKKAIEELEEFIKGPCETCKYCEAAYKLNRKNIIQLLNLTKKLQKENEELKEIYRSEKKMKNEYIKLYQDLLLKENVIPVQKVKDKIRHYQELQDNYIKKYDEINEGLQAMINVLQELIEESEK